MAQVKLLKIATDGVPVEFGTADDITLASFTAGTGGPVLSATGLNLSTQPISGLTNITFASPTTNTINQTASNLIIDNIMAKERSNTLTTAADILFPVITDTAAQVDALRLPAVAGTPTATPTTTGEGFVVWDSTNDKMYVWNGSAWADQTTVSTTSSVQTSYTAGAITAARDVVYISAADNVSPALASAASTAQAVGFAVGAAAAAAGVQVQDSGALSGFSALTAGSRYYLSGTTAGSVTATIPATSGHSIVQVGYAKSATVMQIAIEQMGRRA